MNFYTLKWGDKYDHHYVNRLYGSLKKHCKVPFTFTCYTDNYDGINDEIIIEDIKKLQKYTTIRVFTYEKLGLLERHEGGIWLDLDILIHDDITNIVQTESDFRMIWNYWNGYSPQEESNSYLSNYGSGTACPINSSFVKFKNAEWLVKFTHDNWDKIEFTYKSLDKYLYYQIHRKDKIQFWPQNIFSNYNKEKYTLKNKITLFNTSHIKANNIREISYELHEASDNILDIWKSYDKL